uniref:Uncharacterized protein n=1 Tax=Fusarium oxysporum (strain Fo5176) TaxID=660025 RepID=A0A0D2XGX8_FUSOF
MESPYRKGSEISHQRDRSIASTTISAINLRAYVPEPMHLHSHRPRHSISLLWGFSPCIRQYLRLQPLAEWLLFSRHPRGNAARRWP